MRADSRSQPTTEEHRPPSAGDGECGHPVLLAAFPGVVALSIPASGEVVGRAWLVSAGLPDAEVSGRHLSFSRTGGRLQVEDVGSRNGTYLNGVPLRAKQRTGLDDGDVVRLGKTLLVYREAFTGALSPAPPLGRLVGPWGLTAVRAELLALAARREVNVLLQGETGTGKELLAEAVVEALGRRGKPFAAVNVAGIPASVFEGQLFGWKRGAYSGAVGDSRGVLRAHQGGAVFLDEIGELPLEVQPKILRLLENREILPVGEDRPVRVEVALIAATNRALEAMVERGAFRRDLLARFLVRIDLLPLRERPEDVFAVLQALRERRGTPFDARQTEVEAVERLMLERWPANVRDVERLAAMIGPSAPLTQHAVERALGPPAARVALTREAAEQVLAECRDNQSEAARRLGVSRGKLRRLLGLA
ncbi:sigma 54-interacting transcriptional regulator [Sorangium sp. So ce381]|uniref:sigma 54-interacting transcriptional regulator n=1 Tax=Sorangium sp. So ce381 TaxID=3133307 RepID=UPI003F5C5B3D